MRVRGKLVLVIHLEPGKTFTDELKQEIVTRNNKLINYKRIHGIVVYDEDFPLTASLKIVRVALAERLGRLRHEQAIQPI